MRGEVWGSEEAMDEITIFFLKKNDLDGAACHFFENTYEKKKFASNVKHARYLKIVVIKFFFLIRNFYV